MVKKIHPTGVVRRAGMKYEIFMKIGEQTESTGVVVNSVEEAEERCAVYNDMDYGTGVSYFYKEV